MRIHLGLLVYHVLLLQQALALPKLWKRDADFESVRTLLDHSHQSLEEKEPDKYFHESTFHEHYDGRFANRPLKYDDRRTHLTALIQTYLATMNDLGVETWIMHGSLLGWWWNRRILPWDSDLDVMVTEKSTAHLAAYYNMTVHHFPLPEFDAGRDYLLEINPHYANSSVDGVNKIDARWIDTDTGLFIDITTLRRNTTAAALGLPDAMMVKDKHHYFYDDIFPLRASTFEDHPCKIPYAYADLLVEEYGERALAEVRFDNHQFDAEKQEWVPLRYADRARYGPSLAFSYWGRPGAGVV